MRDRIGDLNHSSGTEVKSKKMSARLGLVIGSRFYQLKRRAVKDVSEDGNAVLTTESKFTRLGRVVLRRLRDSMKIVNFNILSVE